MNSIDVFTLLEDLALIEDQRRQWGNKKHELVDMLFTSLCAIMCGMVDIEGIITFGEERIEWLRQYVELKNGIPSYSTFERILGMLKPDQLEKFYRAWIKQVHNEADTAQIAIDGKSIRGAGAAQKIHMVSAWAKETGLCLGQVRVKEKSNEITAIPKLLDMVDVSECVVSIDAMGCQKAVAAKIVAGGGDYILAVKGNQPTLHEGIPEYIEDQKREREQNIHQWDSGYTKEHGRIERRIITVCECPYWKGVTDEWTDINTLVQYECIRAKVLSDGSYSPSTRETRYYISSIHNPDAKLFAGYLRGHWSIENQLHWVLDVVFKEDSSAIRVNHTPENINVLKKIALSVMRAIKTEKRTSLKAKLARAALNPDFLSLALFGSQSK